MQRLQNGSMIHTTPQQYTYQDEEETSSGAYPGGTYAQQNMPDVQRPTRTRHITIVPVLGASGGYGASTFALNLARTFHAWCYRVCILDADFAKGGLDVLAGCEESEGLRWHNVKAPLGRIDAKDVGKDFIQWEKIPLLAYHAWEAASPRWWEMKAMLDALALQHDVIILDCGQGIHSDMVRAWDAMSASLDIQPLILFQLGALGITRCYSALRAWTDATAGHPFRCHDPVLFLAPARSAQMASRKRVGPMSEKEAEQYLESIIIGQIPYKVACERYEKNGWGVAPTDNAYATMIGVLIRAMAQICLYNWEERADDGHTACSTDAYDPCLSYMDEDCPTGYEDANAGSGEVSPAETSPVSQEVLP